MTRATPSIIDSFMEIVPISDVESHIEAVLCQYFFEPDRERMRKRPVWRVAGLVALKTAVCRLATEALGASHLDPKDIDIKNKEGGAPFIEKVSGPDFHINEMIESGVLVSLSHSRQRAVGLAVLPRKPR